MDTTDQGISVMVVGAGTGGRLIAQGLRKIGIPCTVFERDASIEERPRDWNFGIYWAQSPLNECLPHDLRSKIFTAQVDDVEPAADTYLPVYNGETGEEMKKLPAPYYLRLRRREFSKVLEDGIDVHYGKRLVNIDTESTSGVKAIFEDGSSHSASVLIGAEGAHSYTRNYLMGPEKGKILYSPVVLSMVISKLPTSVALEARKVCPRCSLVFHPDGTFVFLGFHNASDKLDIADWEWIVMTSWIQPEGEQLAFPSSESIIDDMKRRARPYTEPFRSIISAIDPSSKAWSNHLPYWPTQGWDGHPAQGRVTLAGDAAHPMLPHRGQGLNNAILDCHELLKQFEAMPERSLEALNEAVVRYEKEMWERGHEAVVSSLENALAVHQWELAKESPVFKEGVAEPKAQRMVVSEE